MEKSQAEDYLTSLLNKTLRIHTSDKRMFLGQFKCTDSDQNIILSQTFEYRFPPPPKPSTTPQTKITQDLACRYLGLVVVPGQYIIKIEVEEFESQMRGRGKGMGLGLGMGMLGGKGKEREEELTVGMIGGGEGEGV